MARYAEGTSVPVNRSIDQIRTLLLGAGASHYAYGEGPDNAGVQFALHGLHYKFMVRRPTWEDLSARYERAYRVNEAQAIEAEWRRRWRARHLWVKAQIEFAEVEPDAFAQAMLSFLVLPDGRTLGDWAEPQVKSMYAGGAMPPLLASGS
jgi:hypothetical protein